MVEFLIDGKFSMRIRAKNMDEARARAEKVIDEDVHFTSPAYMHDFDASIEGIEETEEIDEGEEPYCSHRLEA